MDAIVELKKSLVKETGKADLDAERITDILTQLGETTVTVEILQSTGIGKVLAKLRKSIKNESIAKKCKDVCKGWKNQVTGGAVAAKAEKISKTKVAAPKVERRMSGFGVQLGTYDSAKRNKVQKLIWEALGARPAETEKKETTTAGAEGDDAEEKFVNVDWNLSREEVTVRIEAAMFAK